MCPSLELPQLCSERYSLCPALVVSDSPRVHLATSPQPPNQPPPWERRPGPVILFISVLLGQPGLSNCCQLPGSIFAMKSPHGSFRSPPPLVRESPRPLGRTWEGLGLRGTRNPRLPEQVK